ncbi:aspartic peptidase domain-containing protein [Mycena epipterygia]|nr:aspartic peptidase domain-containing protein [Mycena epipterygia]
MYRSLAFLLLIQTWLLPVASATEVVETRSNNADLYNNVIDQGNFMYGVNVTIAGTSLTVIIDTGSTDMYISSPPGGIGPFNDTGAVAALHYEDGAGINGTVGLASFEIAGYTIPAQAFINVTNGAGDGFSGLVGLGFDAPSDPIPSGLTAVGLNGTLIGKSVLSSIFDQNPDKPRMFGLSLSRNGDQGGTANGSLTIGEYDVRYSAVQHAPLLSQFPEGSNDWSVLMDGIFVNDVQIPWATDPKGTVPAGKVHGLLDSDTTLFYVPEDIRNAIYSIVPGAVHTAQNSSWYGDAWVIPCDTAIDLHTMFGQYSRGQNFTLHPLDLSNLDVLSGPDGQNYTVCTGAIDDGLGIGRDARFGQTFLRNVYTVFAFGNETTGAYVQMLSQTNKTAAVADFSAIRLQQLGSGPPELTPADLVQLFDGPLPTSTGDLGGSSQLVAAQQDIAANVPSTSTDSKLSKYGPIVIGLLGANLALLLLLLSLAVFHLVSSMVQPAASRTNIYLID